MSGLVPAAVSSGVVFLVLFVLFFLLPGLRVCQEYERAIVFRLGRYASVRGPGLYWLFPMIERQMLIDLRTKTQGVEQQETITKDSVTIRVDAVLWYHVSAPAKAVLNVVDYDKAVYQVALTSLRNIIGQHLLDEVLKERDSINARLASIVDEATEAWGVKVEMVEMKDVEIPESMQRAMAREAEAMREKRARLIKAEAESEASLKLCNAAQQIGENPVALELRRLQMVSEVGAEHNTTTIVLLPSEFVTAAGAISKMTETPKKVA